MLAYSVDMIISWRRLAIHMARKIAANPEARTQAVDMAKKVRQEAKQIAADPSPARAAGRTGGLSVGLVV